MYPRGRRGGKVRSLSAHMAKHMQLGPPPPQPGTLKWVELQRGAAYGSSKGSPREGGLGALGSAAAQAAGVEATAETKVAADAVSLAVKGRARGAAGKKAASRRRRPRKGLE